MNNFELGYKARKNGVSPSNECEMEIMVQVRAPDSPEEIDNYRRGAMNLAFVVDRSGSMSGRPLEEAKRCVLAMMKNLRRDDGVSLVSYDEEVEILQPCLPLGNGHSFQNYLDSIDARGMTNLHGGWLQGASSLADALEDDRLSRVILLSDGRANRGLVNQQRIASQCARMAAAGVSTSTYGLGNGFNEDLMMAVGRAGQGNHYYGELAEDLLEPFHEELAFLENLCARKVTLEVKPFPGVKFELLNDYTQIKENTYKLPDLAFDAEVWSMLQLSVSTEAFDERNLGTNLRLLELVACYDDMTGKRHTLPKVIVTLPIISAEAFTALAEDEMVLQRLMELEAGRYQFLAGEAARLRDWGEVDRLLSMAREKATDNPWVGEVLGALERIAAKRDEQRFRKESHFSSMKMSRRLASKTELMYGTDEPETKKAAYLRRKKEQGKNEFRDDR